MSIFQLKHFRTKRRGVVLLMSMLIMATITASTIAVATLIVVSIRQTTNLNNFILASVAADSGIERSLAVVKAGRDGQLIKDTVGTGQPATIGRTSVAGGSAATFETASQPTSEAFTVPVLQENKVLDFDLLKYIDEYGATHEAPTFIKITGDPLPYNSVTSSENPYLELIWEVLSSDSGGTGTSRFTGREYVNDLITPTIRNLNVRLTDENGLPPSGSLLTQALGYRIHLRPVNTNGLAITNLKLVPCPSENDCSNPLDLPTHISITSTGKLGQSQSEKRASVLWQVPASGLFQNVLFTEGEIIPQ